MLYLTCIQFNIQASLLSVEWSRYSVFYAYNNSDSNKRQKICSKLGIELNFLSSI